MPESREKTSNKQRGKASPVKQRNAQHEEKKTQAPAFPLTDYMCNKKTC